MNFEDINKGLNMVNKEDENLLTNMYNDLLLGVSDLDKPEVERAFQGYLNRRKYRINKGNSENIFELIKLLEEDLIMINFYIGELEGCLVETSLETFKGLMEKSLLRRKEKTDELKLNLFKLSYGV